ncbi:MAG TPA: pyridoxamine 5'-phosphate oxidase family protein [Dermatophilaceae bacterium]|nr:pyridoxamine 5'-phosphate oxidase family protein [Dermatophilaceae bacterium]
MNDPVGEAPSMADYGVGGVGWRALPWSWAAERLAAAGSFWLVTASGDGRPHALPVWGVWDDDEHRFAFSCSPNSRKAANLAANPQVVVAPGDTVECVSVEGRAHRVDEHDRRETWIARYLAKYRPLSADLSDDFLRAHVLFEVVPERAFAIIERQDEFADRATRWRF